MNINFGLHSQRKGGFKFMHYQPHIRCNIAYTPWPSAYCPPSRTTIYLGNITSFLSALLSHFQPNTDTGHLVLFSGLWVNPFSRWVVRLYCHNQLCVPTC